jgi:hypothetical protein
VNVSRFAKAGLIVGLAVGLAAVALPAGANHNADYHSANMSNLFNSPNGRNVTNSDLAFWGKYAYQGDYGGFRIFDISNPASPQLVGNFNCPGPQMDLTVFDRDGNGQADIAFGSVDSVRTGPQCGAPPASPATSPTGWEGLRIIDISNPANPTQIGTVYLDCGSHTNTLWPDPARNRVLLWNSSYPLGSGPTCGQTTGPPNGRDPNHGVIQIVEAKWSPTNPLGPVTAAEIAEPKIVYPGDPDNKFTPAEHGLPGPPVLEPSMRACHDITVYTTLRLAAAACAEQGQLWRVDANGMPDTENPIWVIDDTVDETGTTGNPNDPGVVVDFWHSATFSWDGKIINFIDESFGAGCPPVTAVGAAVPNRQPGDTGRMFFVDAASGKLLSSYMNSRPLENTYCSAHLGNVVPATDKYLLANAWYAGGASVVDFTNPAAPNEIAWYDFAPAGPTGSNNWSLYWYEGPALPEPSLTLYGTDGLLPGSTSARGFQVFKADVDSNELNFSHLNPQTQELVIGPGGALRCKGKIATLVGTNQKDEILGTNGNDVILARGGNDEIKSRDGSDTVCAGRGRDEVRAGNSDKGGKGDMVFGQGGRDRLFGQGAKDLLRGGSKGDLIKAGSGQNDASFGQGGNDEVRGQGGSDKVVGGGGVDYCNGGSGVDTEATCETRVLFP